MKASVAVAYKDRPVNAKTRNDVVQATPAPREKGDPEFGRRFWIACDRSTTLPEKNFGLFSLIRKRLMNEHGIDVTLETVRKWSKGATVPRQDKLGPLAAVLEVDPKWLRHGIETSAKSKPVAINPDATGPINLVAGALQLAGYQVAFIDPDDDNAEIGHFYVIVKGRQRIVYVTGAVDDTDGAILLKVPARHEKLTCIAAVPSSELTFEFFPIDPEMIEAEGDRLGTFVEMSGHLTRAGMKFSKGNLLKPAQVVEALF